ncbi:MAG: SMC-Scp complex subunit ScpB [Eubacteriales Family XIII. Incertae Sedis bacterium]|nr:MAG: SMC-Scp complex subunit ScpB [Clostridiales Family XIII bacterium]PWM69128.1 MAG: SMC-Scp complex subunit ScpB [Clostridiales Family XIII bacterium]
MTSRKSIKSALESMMFTWGEPLSAKTAAEVVNINWKEAYECFKELEREYEEEGRGIRIREVNKAFQFVTLADNSEYIERLCTPVKQKRLSQSALEVLAIVAYKQPVTRSEVEAIRGIKCDRVLEGLEKKELIAEVGRSAGIGRPILYGTTDTFLRSFGFTNIKELPDIDDIEGVIAVRDEGIETGEPDAQQVEFDLSGSLMNEDMDSGGAFGINAAGYSEEESSAGSTENVNAAAKEECAAPAAEELPYETEGIMDKAAGASEEENGER